MFTLRAAVSYSFLTFVLGAGEQVAFNYHPLYPEKGPPGFLE